MLPQVNKKKDFIEYLDETVTRGISKTDELYATVLELKNMWLLETGNYKKAIQNLLVLKDNFTESPGTEKYALFNLGYLYQKELGDKVSAKKYYDELEKKYPDDILVTDSKILLGETNEFGNVPEIPDIQQTNPESTITNESVQLSNYPNPFNPSTVIKFSLPVTSNVTLTIYNMMGQEIKTLTSDNLSEGIQQFTWNGTNKNNELVSSGIYIYRIQAVGNDGRSFTKSAKMTLLK